MSQVKPLCLELNTFHNKFYFWTRRLLNKSTGNCSFLRAEYLVLLLHGTGFSGFFKNPNPNPNWKNYKNPNPNWKKTRKPEPGDNTKNCQFSKIENFRNWVCCTYFMFKSEVLRTIRDHFLDFTSRWFENSRKKVQKMLICENLKLYFLRLLRFFLVKSTHIFHHSNSTGSYLAVPRTR